MRSDWEEVDSDVSQARLAKGGTAPLRNAVPPGRAVDVGGSSKGGQAGGAELRRQHPKVMFAGDLRDVRTQFNSFG